MSLPWYKEGLRFECTGCGGCCTGFPGFVWVSEDEMEKLASYLDISVKEFKKKYTRLLDGKISLKEEPKTYDCVFLKGKQCTIYPLRPKQCRTFPFWPQHLASQKAWKEVGRHCEGIRQDATLVDLKTIQEQLKKHLEG